MSMVTGVTASTEKLVEKQEAKPKRAAKASTPKDTWGRPQRDPEYITSLFQQRILQLVLDLKTDDRIELKGKKEVTGQVEVIETSHLYHDLKGGLIEMDTLLLAMLELNRYYYKDLKDDVNAKVTRDKCITAITKCVDRLIKNGEWTHVEAKELCAGLSLMQEKKNAEDKEALGDSRTYEEDTPIDLLISALCVTGYSSDDIQGFIKWIVGLTQFKPVKNILKNKKLTDAEKHAEIVEKISEFFTKTEKTSYEMMSEPNSLLNKVVRLFIGNGSIHFQENTVSTAAVFLRKLRTLHLECFEEKETKSKPTKAEELLIDKLLKELEEKPEEQKEEQIAQQVESQLVEKKEKLVEKKEKLIEKKEKSSKKKEKLIEKKEEARIEVTTKTFSVSEETYMASFAVEVTKDAEVVKSMTLQKMQGGVLGEKEVYLFVQTVQSPEEKPDYTQKLSTVPLFKIEHTPHTNLVEIKQEVDAIRNTVVSLIEKEKYGCMVHTAIDHSGTLMLTEINWQIGNMLNVALLWAIKTYIASKKVEKTGCCVGSEPEYDLVELEAYLTVYVRVTSEYLNKFWRETFFKRQNVKSLRSVDEQQTTGVSMRQVSKDVMQLLEEKATAKKPLFKWLDLSIRETFNDPKGKMKTTLAASKKTAQEGLQLHGGLDQLRIDLEQGKQKAVIGSVDAIITGIWDTIRHHEKDKALSFIKANFKSNEDFPSDEIKNILGESISSKQKTIAVFASLFRMGSLGLKKVATKEDLAAIKSYLKQL